MELEGLKRDIDSLHYLNYSLSVAFCLINKNISKIKYLAISCLFFVSTNQAWSQFSSLTGDNPEYQSAGTQAGVPVAVIDTGVDYTHVDIRERILFKDTKAVAYDFLSLDERPYDLIVKASHYMKLSFGFFPFLGFLSDDFVDLLLPSSGGHGTHVAGIVLSQNPKAAIIPVRVRMIGQSLASINEGIRFAIQNGARIVNLSLGVYADTWEKNSLLMDELREMKKLISQASDTLFVVAAGNENNDLRVEKKRFVPATFHLPNLLTVGAINDKKELADFSNIGENIVDVYAPGVHIKSAWPSGDLLKPGYHVASGTSMATPYVSGLASRILEAKANLSGQELRDEVLALAKVQRVYFQKNDETLCHLDRALDILLLP